MFDWDNPTLKDRPRIGPGYPRFNFLINRQGKKTRYISRDWRAMLRARGWVDAYLDWVNKSAPNDTPLIFRYRGGLGDIITALPGIENFAAEWPHVDLAFPREFHFLFRHIPNVSVYDYFDMFGVRTETGTLTDKYLDVVNERKLAIDIFCPAGSHEQETDMNPTKSRIENFVYLLHGEPHAASLCEKNFSEDDVMRENTLFDGTKFGDLIDGDTGPIVGIQFESENISKDWPKERYQELAALLYRTGCTPVAMHPKAALPKVPSMVGWDLEHVGAAMLHMAAVVGPDSGLLHMAAALDIPTLWLFGPTNGDLTIKYYRKAHVITGYLDLPCSYPCYYSAMNGYFCENANGACMLNITARNVALKLKKMLLS